MSGASDDQLHYSGLGWSHSGIEIRRDPPTRWTRSVTCRATGQIKDGGYVFSSREPEDEALDTLCVWCRYPIRYGLDEWWHLENGQARCRHGLARWQDEMDEWLGKHRGDVGDRFRRKYADAVATPPT